MEKRNGYDHTNCSQAVLEKSVNRIGPQGSHTLIPGLYSMLLHRSPLYICNGQAADCSNPAKYSHVDGNI